MRCCFYGRYIYFEVSMQPGLTEYCSDVLEDNKGVLKMANDPIRSHTGRRISTFAIASFASTYKRAP